MEKKTFRSRISVLLVGFVIACFLPVFVPMICSGNILNPGFYIMIGTLAFIVLICTGMRYTITDGRLSIKMWGVTTGSVEISNIISAERSYNLISSPAASLKRLCIRFKKGYKWPYYLISPVREQEFLETLKEINPEIYIRADNKKAWYRVWDWDI